MLGQEISITQPIEIRFNEILEGNRSDITLYFIGKDRDVLYELSNKSIPVLRKIEGALTVELDPLTALKKIKSLMWYSIMKNIALRG